MRAYSWSTYLYLAYNKVNLYFYYTGNIWLQWAADSIICDPIQWLKFYNTLAQIRSWKQIWPCFLYEHYLTNFQHFFIHFILLTAKFWQTDIAVSLSLSHTRTHTHTHTHTITHTQTHAHTHTHTSKATTNANEKGKTVIFSGNRWVCYWQQKRSSFCTCHVSDLLQRNQKNINKYVVLFIKL